MNIQGFFIKYLHTLFGKRLNIKKYEKQDAFNLFKSKTECYNGGGVYFIKQNNSVKIGYSAIIQNRISELQVGSPEKQEFLFTIQGTMKTEQYLHRKFKQYNIRGEWFNIEGKLKEFIEYFMKFRNSFIKLGNTT